MRSRHFSKLIAVLVCGICLGFASQAAMAVTVSSLAQLRSVAASLNNATITLAPGEYWIDGDHIANPTSSIPTFLQLGGSNNTYNFSGTEIKLDTRDLAGFGRALGHDSGVTVVEINGANNTVNDLNVSGYDVFEPGSSRHEQRYADWAASYVRLTGTDNTVDGINVMTRGSSPYGLGDAFGKGARQSPQGEPADEGGLPWIGHNKTSAFQVLEANGAVINDMHLDVRSYGHGFFVQLSDDTTLTNSTVTGELFPSTNVSTHPLYIEYGGVTKDGNPIPEDIFISGAEDGVRMYTGASNLTVDNVVVTNMRSGFAVALGAGDISLNNVESYGAEHGFDFRRNTTITNAKGDITNGPLIWNPYSNTANSSIEVELVGEAPVGHDWAAAFVSGSNVDVTISSDLPAGALGEDALVRFGQRWWNDWRDHDDLDSFDEDAFDYINSTFTNNTNQMLVLGNDVTGNDGSSQAPVISNGKDNAYDGVTWVPTGSRLEVEHVKGMGNPGDATAGTYDSNGTKVFDGATLEIEPSVRVSDERVTITGDGMDGKGAIYSDGSPDNGTRLVGNGSNEIVVLDGDASIGVGTTGNFLLVNRVSGTGDLTKRGLGNLSMEKSSTFDGDLIIAEGGVVARGGVVHTNLFVNSRSWIGAISNMLNTPEGHVELYGTMDLNMRTDDNVITGVIGRLDGGGRITSSNPFVGAGGSLEIAGNGEDGAFDGGIDGFVSVVKSGSNTQTFSGSMTHTGTTSITGGTLLIDGTHTGGGAYSVASGTLGGNGSIDADITVGANGTVSPGASAGQLTVEEIVFEMGATLEIELGGTGAGTEYDQLLTDTITFGGDLSISLIDLGSGEFLPDPTDAFNLVLANALNGEFDNVANGARIDTLGGEGSFIVSYGRSTLQISNFLASTDPGDFDADGDLDGADFLAWQRNPGLGNLSDWQANYGNDGLPLAASTAVPEPTSAMLCLFAMAVASVMQRRC